MGASGGYKPARGGIHSDPARLRGTRIVCAPGGGGQAPPAFDAVLHGVEKFLPRLTVCARLVGPNDDTAFTASTVGYCLPHPSPTNRGGVMFWDLPPVHPSPSKLCRKSIWHEVEKVRSQNQNFEVRKSPC